MKKRINLLLASYRTYAASFLFVLVALVALSVANVNAQCKQWEATGSWSTDQSNGFTLEMNIHQNGTAISGTAQYVSRDRYKDKDKGFLPSFGSPDANVTGTVSGTLIGNDYRTEINWGAGRVGIYLATISEGGSLDGTTYEKGKPKNSANWHSGRAMLCPSRDNVKTIVHTGKVITAPPPKANPPSGKATPTPFKIPGIVASPPVFLPNAYTGFVVLQWDGGGDHQYAEVWVKEGNSDEKFLVEKGKGTQQFQVTRGVTYLYILTDAGSRLATVSVSAR